MANSFHSGSVASVLLIATVLALSDSVVFGEVAMPQLKGKFANLTAYAASRRELSSGGCSTGNPIDDCWRCDSNWESHRQSLADCAIGFGKYATGGRNGRIYVVTDSGNDDPQNPKEGTLRWGAIQDEPLWIVFSKDMVIQLEQELIMNSFKTIDGRGQNVHIANGACITIQFVQHVIVHNVHIHDCKSTGPALVRSSPSHIGHRGTTDGDGVSIFGASNIWIDHNYITNTADGLVDVIEGSTAVTISNNYFTDHDKVMLLGAHDGDSIDDSMQITVALNHFGPGLIQRMPRCRRGTFHIVNNFYQAWGMYAIGGSAAPTINSEGNTFYAPNNADAKEVTKRITGNWKSWNWRSNGDLFFNNAYFIPSGAGTSSPFYKRSESYSAIPASRVSYATANSGPI